MDGVQHRAHVDSVGFPSDDDLLRFAQVEIQHAQHLRNGARRFVKVVTEKLQRLFRRVAIRGAVGKLRQPQQQQRRHRIAARLRAVVVFFRAHDDAGVMSVRLEKAAVFRVMELRQHGVRERGGLEQPLWVEIRFVEIDEAVAETCVVLNHRRHRRRAGELAVLPTAGEEVTSGALGGRAIFRFVERLRGARQRGNHQTVPSRQDLLVPVGSHTFFPNGEKL